MVGSRAMKLGCLGCLGTVLGLFLLCGLIGGALWAWSGIQGTPPPLPASGAKADPGAVERKLAEIGLRGSGRSTRSEPLLFSEPELATLLSTYLSDAGFGLSPIALRLRPSRVTLQGRLPLSALVQGSPVAWTASVLPRSTLQSPIWITLVGRVELEPPVAPRRPRYAEAILLESRVGRIFVPGWLLSLILGPRGASLLRWQVSGVVGHLEVGENRLTIRTR
jgi:hypothetical protein